jgi:hypothetical protein
MRNLCKGRYRYLPARRAPLGVQIGVLGPGDGDHLPNSCTGVNLPSSYALGPNRGNVGGTRRVGTGPGAPSRGQQARVAGDARGEVPLRVPAPAEGPNVGTGEPLEVGAREGGREDPILDHGLGEGA